MSEYTAHDPTAFYRELFGAAVDLKAPADDSKHDTENINNNSEVEIKSKNSNHQLSREEFLEVINYASPNYNARRRARLFPTIASVTSYF